VEDELAAGVPPDRIGYVSFTKRAAHEAAERACQRFSLSHVDLPYFRTLHSLCFRQLGLSGGDVLEGKKLMTDFAQYAGVRITGRFSEDGLMSGFEMGDRIIFMENLARVRCVSLEEQYRLDSDQLPWVLVSQVSRALATYKSEHNLMDYTDMLSEFVRSGIEVPLEVLVVDEAQDLSRLQWDVVSVLARKARRVCVAGDDDQAIYRWSGADSDHLIRLEGDSRVLGQSYRVPPAVQDVAGRMVPHMGNRRQKDWAAKVGTEGSVGYAQRFGDIDCGFRLTASGEPVQVLVLARNTYILWEQVIPHLRRQGIVWHHNDKPSVSSGVLGSIEAWERLRQGGSVTLQVARQLYDRMSSGVGVRRGFKELHVFDDRERVWDEEQNKRPRAEQEPFTVTKADLHSEGGLLVDGFWFDVLDRVPAGEREYIRTALATIKRSGTEATLENLTKPRVRISTIHGSKGGEADRVVLLKEIAARTFQEMRWASEDEARVWYVAVTRAREQLTIVDSTTPRACPWL
jgi:DNA helicase-2/ATP-dependent DNA helicase PcrA